MRQGRPTGVAKDARQAERGEKQGGWGDKQADAGLERAVTVTQVAAANEVEAIAMLLVVTTAAWAVVEQVPVALLAVAMVVVVAVVRVMGTEEATKVVDVKAEELMEEVVGEAEAKAVAAEEEWVVGCAAAGEMAPMGKEATRARASWVVEMVEMKAAAVMVPPQSLPSHVLSAPETKRQGLPRVQTNRPAFRARGCAAPCSLQPRHPFEYA